MQQFKPVGALLFTMLVWGIAPVFLRSQSVQLGPADSLVIRYVIVSLFYGLTLLLHGPWRIAREDWPRLLVTSLIGMLGYNLGSMYGFEYAPAGIGGLVYATQPLLIALAAGVLLRERLTVFAGAGIAMATAGTALLFWRDAMVASGGSLVYGGTLLFLGCIAWAVYVIASRPLLDRYGVLPTTAWSIILATLPMLALATPETAGTLAAMTARQWADLLFLAVVSTFIATLTWNYGSARLSAVATGAFLYLIPVIAVIAGALLLGEAVTPDTVAGGALILAGVAVAQFGPRWRMAGLRRM